MFPILAIAGVIGAVASVAKGASWLSDHISASKPADPTTTKDGTSTFSTKLAAQAAGQTVPGGVASTQATTGTALVVAAPPVSMLPIGHSTDYTSLASIRAGMAAYDSVGDRLGNHGNTVNPPVSGDDLSRGGQFAMARL